jgi:hypothetical protein
MIIASQERRIPLNAGFQGGERYGSFAQSRGAAVRRGGGSGDLNMGMFTCGDGWRGFEILESNLRHP